MLSATPVPQNFSFADNFKSVYIHSDTLSHTVFLEFSCSVYSNQTFALGT